MRNSGSQVPDRARVAALYGSPYYRCYAGSKLRTDPLYGAVASALLQGEGPALPLLDLGCGIGLLAFYLRESGYASPILGLDYDAAKVNAAEEIAARFYPGLSFRHYDARDELPEFRGNVTVLDILQYFDVVEQRRLLSRAAVSVAPGGRLVIRTGLRDSTWRFRVTRWADILAGGLAWMKAGPDTYPTRDFIETALTAEGLMGEVHPLWGKTPFNNYLCVYTRPDNGVTPRSRESTLR